MTTLTNSNLQEVFPAFIASTQVFGMRKMRVKKPQIIGPVFHVNNQAHIYFTRREGEKLKLNLHVNGEVIKQTRGVMSDEKATAMLARWMNRRDVRAAAGN